MAEAIELDWAAWDAGHRGGGESAHTKAHNTASAHAKATAKARAKHRTSKMERSLGGAMGYKDTKAKSASQLKYGHHVLYGNRKTQTMEDHRVVSAQRKPNGSIRLHTIAPDGSHHYQSMKPDTQVSVLPGPNSDYAPALANTGGGIELSNLTAALAARGVADPRGLASYLTRGGGTYDFADGEEFGGQGTGTCPSCGYKGSSSSFGLDSSPEALRTPAPDTGYVRNGAPLTVKGGGSAPGLANASDGIELSRRLPVSGPNDIVVARGADGTAIIRHRSGGAEIGRLTNTDGWRAIVGGRQGSAHTHQRGALSELLGLWNKGTTTLQRPASEPAVPFQAQPQQTQLMQQLGIPAVRALATPATGAGNGPRATYMAYDPDNDGDDDASTSGGDTDKDGAGGLTPRGKAIYAKLIAKKIKPAVALAMARRSQNGPPGSKS